ncbi:MAG: asparaginase [Deltaproteobacteria bacterium]|nr:asparaginase [Deltaproteobacteria bacterium]
MAEKRITVVFTGGTIAMGVDPGTGGAVPLLSGEDLMTSMPDLKSVATINILNFCNKPGPHILLNDVFDLSKTIKELFEKNQSDGVVITHGTDTLEETAYALDLLSSFDNPVIVTGSMRNSSMISADGPANLFNSILTAANNASRSRGVMVVFNNEIHTARDVTKASATQLNAFRSPLFGPIGMIYGRSVQFVRQGGFRESIEVEKVSACVELIKFTLGMSTFLLDVIRDSTIDGVVVEGAGVGHVSQEVAQAVKAIVATGKPVVLTSRCYENLVLEDNYAFVGSEEYLRELGAIPAPGLSGPKARIKLILALSQTRDLKSIRDIFNVPVEYRQ